MIRLLLKALFLILLVSFTFCSGFYFGARAERQQDQERTLEPVIVIPGQPEPFTPPPLPKKPEPPAVPLPYIEPAKPPQPAPPQPDTRPLRRRSR